MVSAGGVVLDMDPTPKPICSHLRRVFPRQMRSNPETYWKSHFSFETWMPKEGDDSDAVCETTNECRGQDMAGRPQCKCKNGKLLYSDFKCDQNVWGQCAAEVCSKLGCNSTALSGKEKDK